MGWYIILDDGETYGVLDGAVLLEVPDSAELEDALYDDAAAVTLRRLATRTLDSRAIANLLDTDEPTRRQRAAALLTDTDIDGILSQAN
jgi:hypothetical protein